MAGRLLAPFLVAVSLSAAIAPVQSNYSTQNASKVSIAFKKSQGQGNLNLVVIGWNDSGESVASVTDSKGNSYSIAVGPATYSGQLSQSIYYAKNIAAGSNTITVTFKGNPSSPEIRIFEYSGANLTTPIDAVVQATGSSTTMAAGPLTTICPNDLLFAADIGVGTTTGAGPGFTERLLVNGDGVEDEVVGAPGSYNATAPVKPSDPWIMQVVAVCPASTGPPPTQIGLTVAPTTASFVAAGAQQALTVTAQFSDGSTRNVTTSSSYSSGVSSIASVSAAGVVTAVGNGTVNIQAGYGGFIATCSVTVAIPPPPPPPTLTGLAVAPASFTLDSAGATEQLTVTGTFSNGTTANVTSNATYGSSNVVVASVSTAGLVEAVANGSGAITVTYGGFNVGAAVTVAIPVAHSATLSWTASTTSNPGGSIAGYNAYRSSTSGGLYTKLTSTLVTLTSYVDATVQAGATYYYVVTAVDNLGNESEFSNQVQAVIPTP